MEIFIETVKSLLKKIIISFVVVIVCLFLFWGEAEAGQYAHVEDLSQSTAPCGNYLSILGFVLICSDEQYAPVVDLSSEVEFSPAEYSAAIEVEMQVDACVEAEVNYGLKEAKETKGGVMEARLRTVAEEECISMVVSN